MVADLLSPARTISSNVIYGAKQVKDANFLKHQKRVDDFINSYKFQMFCDNPQNGIKKGCVIQVTIGRENGVYPLAEDLYLEGMTINKTDVDGLYFYKTIHPVCRKLKPSEKRIFYSASFLVTCAEDIWKAELILDDDAYLSRSAFQWAAKKYSDVHHYDLSSLPQLVEMPLELDGTVMVTSKFYYVEVSDQNSKRWLVCLLDNGKFLDIPQPKELPQPVLPPIMGIVKTKYTILRYQGSGKFERYKGY